MSFARETNDKIIEVQKGIDYQVIEEDNVKAATRIMRGKIGNRDAASKEDIDLMGKLSILSLKGDKEAEYKLYQLNREINEGTIRMNLDGVNKSLKFYIVAKFEPNRLKRLYYRGVANIYTFYARKGIKGALKRAIGFRRKMDKLAGELGKTEVFSSELNLDELAQKYNVK